MSGAHETEQVQRRILLAVLALAATFGGLGRDARGAMRQDDGRLEP